MRTISTTPDILPGPAEPDRDCRLCTRLQAFRDEHRQTFPDWHNAPVPSFGPVDAPLLIVGLAPGLRGANRTGRPFTGDYAGDLLYPTLVRHGFARGSYERRSDDGLELIGCRITNAVRCVPPQNKPVGAEINACRDFLFGELAIGQRIVLALGGVAHRSIVRALGLRAVDVPFVHGALHHVGDARVLADSYHCSRYNVNTNRLTAEMFDQVIGKISRLLSTNA